MNYEVRDVSEMVRDVSEANFGRTHVSGLSDVLFVDLASPEVFTSRMIPKPIVGTSSAGATTAAEVHIDRVHSLAILMILLMSVYVMMVKFE